MVPAGRGRRIQHISTMPPKVTKAHVLDVRRLLENGDHPVPILMESLSVLEPGEVVVLITPFLPSPLIATVQSEGYAARPERQADGSWQTRFWRR